MVGRFLALVVAVALGACGDGPQTAGSTTDASTTGSTGEPSAECGNAVVEAGEDCDDGNAVDGDGCNPDCVPSGAERWTRYHDGPAHGDDEAAAVAIADDGTIYVVGQQAQSLSDTELDPGLDRNIVVMALDSSGNFKWMRTHAGSRGARDAATDVAVTNDGDIVVTGYVGLGNETSELWVGRYDPTGTLQWQDQYGGSAPTSGWSGTNMGRAVDARPGGGSVVTGVLYHEEDGELIGHTWVIAHDDAGNAEWSINLTALAIVEGGSASLHVKEDGTVLVTTNSRTWDSQAAWLDLTALDPTGAHLWTSRVHELFEPYVILQGGRLLEDSDGSILVGGGEVAAFPDPQLRCTSTPLVWRLDPDGDLLSTLALGDTDFPGGFVTGLDTWPSGDLAWSLGSRRTCTGPTAHSEGFDAWFARTAATGDLRWIVDHAGPANLADAAVDVAVDPDGDVVVVGRETVVFQQSDVWISKRAP